MEIYLHVKSQSKKQKGEKSWEFLISFEINNAGKLLGLEKIMWHPLMRG